MAVAPCLTVKLHPSEPCSALHWHIQSEPIWPRPMKPELEAEQVALEAYRRKCTLSTFSGHTASSLCSPSTYHTASGNRSGGSLRAIWIHACTGLRLLLTRGKQTNNTTSYNHTDNYRATIIGLFFNTYSVLNASWDLGFRGHTLCLFRASCPSILSGLEWAPLCQSCMSRRWGSPALFNITINNIVNTHTH